MVSPATLIDYFDAIDDEMLASTRYSGVRMFPPHTTLRESSSGAALSFARFNTRSILTGFNILADYYRRRHMERIFASKMMDGHARRATGYADPGRAESIIHTRRALRRLGTDMHYMPMPTLEHDIYYFLFFSFTFCFSIARRLGFRAKNEYS